MNSEKGRLLIQGGDYIYIYICTGMSVVSWQTYASHNIWMALLVQSYLSNMASFVLCVCCRVKDHQHLLHDSPALDN